MTTLIPIRLLQLLDLLVKTETDLTFHLLQLSIGPPMSVIILRHYMRVLRRRPVRRGCCQDLLGRKQPFSSPQHFRVLRRRVRSLQLNYRIAGRCSALLQAVIEIIHA